ncbi:thermonuclease family protein [Calidithermus chliarophilus]|uniref:thermonuclease family protein n=1 Tax=Calidithermus chliarophilus TaxID=52023 RepID=UPI000489C826|nr:hypothetical protein [Calidithermus chliarophilus]
MRTRNPSPRRAGVSPSRRGSSPSPALLPALGLLCLAALLGTPALAQPPSSLAGRATVVDGDTLEIQGVRIRLWGVDAVESSQTCLDAQGKVYPCGRRAQKSNGTISPDRR